MIPDGRVLFSDSARTFVTGVCVTASGEVYLALRQHVIAGEILSRGMHHVSDDGADRATVGDSRSVMNYEVLSHAHPNTVRAAVRRAGQRKAFRLLPRALWVRVHGD